MPTVTLAITPNPNAKVFLSDRTLMEGNSYLELRTEEEIDEETPELCAVLIRTPYVRQVFVMHNFITIVKSAAAQWDTVEPELLECIETHIADFAVDCSTLMSEDADETGIRHVIDSYLAPAIAVDGGAIRFHSFDSATGELTVDVLGSCHGCPSLINTLQRGIKPMLTELFPQVTAVVRRVE